MTTIENHCVGCDKHCIYEACPYYSVEACRCDHCRERAPAVYRYNGWDYCGDCFEKELDRQLCGLPVEDKIELLALYDDIMEV